MRWVPFDAGQAESADSSRAVATELLRHRLRRMLARPEPALGVRRSGAARGTSLAVVKTSARPMPSVLALVDFRLVQTVPLHVRCRWARRDQPIDACACARP